MTKYEKFLLAVNSCILVIFMVVHFYLSFEEVPPWSERMHGIGNLPLDYFFMFLYWLYIAIVGFMIGLNKRNIKYQFGTLAVITFLPIIATFGIYLTRSLVNIPWELFNFDLPSQLIGYSLAPISILLIAYLVGIVLYFVCILLSKFNYLIYKSFFKNNEK